MNDTTFASLAIASLTLALAAPAFAEDAQKPSQNWSVNCVSQSRLAPALCSMEQRVLIRESGQQLGRLVIKVGGSDTGPGAFLLQIPLGVSIRDGIKLKVDENDVETLDIQTCDASGCFAGEQVGKDLLAAMKTGTGLAATFNDMQKRPVTVNFVLSGFSAAYDSIQ